MGEKNIFVFENYNTGEHFAFHSLSEAELYAVKWYLKEHKKFYDSDAVLNGIRQCLEEFYIDDECRIHEVEFFD